MAEDINCSLVGNDVREFCIEIKKKYIENDAKLDSIQTKIYIIAGVGGGIALVLILTLITLAVQLSRLRARANVVTSRARQSPNNGKKLSKTLVEPQQNGQSVQHHHHQSPPPHSFAQQPRPPVASAEDELAQLGFSAYTGQHIEPARGFSSSSPAINSSGGVRVLPLHPPPGFRQNAGYNEGYM